MALRQDPVRRSPGLGAAGADTLNPTEKLSCYWAAVCCWGLAALFFVGWWWPTRLDGGAWVGVPVATIFVEFFLLYSSFFFVSGFRGGPSYNVTGALLIAALFGAVIGAFAFAYGSVWVLCYGLTELAGRVVGVVRNSDFDRAVARMRLIAGFGIYLGLAALVLIIAPTLPSGGITPQLIETFCPGKRSCGASGPLQNVHAFMVLYFLLLGGVELAPLGARIRGSREVRGRGGEI